MPRSRATMKDVARVSGFSPATVSFVLNGSAGQSIPLNTQERVRAAAAELGYVPHGLARALREGSSRIIVLNVARLPHGSKSLSSFIDGLDAELERHDHTLLVRYGDKQGGIERTVSAISPKAVLDLDKIYFNPDSGLDSDNSPGLGPNIEIDDGGWSNGIAAHTAVQIRYLMDRGHERLAMAVMPGRFEHLAAIRLASARRVVAEAGFPDITVLTMDGSLESNRSALATLREQNPEISAIAGLDDEAALRVLAAARKLGVKVPAELAVIGFDGGAPGELFSPSLTTVQVDAAAFGRAAARTMLGVPLEEEIPGPATVIVRDSA